MWIWLLGFLCYTYGMTEPKNSIMSYLIDEQNRGNFLHSSGYAKGNYGENMGSAGGNNEAFSARQEIERRRQFIKRYNNARVISYVRAFDRVRGTVLNGAKTTSTRSRLAKSSPQSVGRVNGATSQGVGSTTSRPAMPPSYRNPGIHR